MFVKKVATVFLLLLMAGNRVCAEEVIVDELVERMLRGNTEYKERVPIYVSPVNFISTKDKKLHEGQWLKFTVSEDYVVDDKIIVPKGSSAVGRAELVTRNNAVGSPADITISNFVIRTVDNKGIEKLTKLDGSIVKTGANRAVWVAPLGYVTGVFTLVGFGFWAIRGGHAKVKPNQIYPLQYAQKL